MYVLGVKNTCLLFVLQSLVIFVCSIVFYGSKKAGAL